MVVVQGEFGSVTTVLGHFGPYVNFFAYNFLPNRDRPMQSSCVQLVRTHLLTC